VAEVDDWRKILMLSPRFFGPPPPLLQEIETQETTTSRSVFALFEQIQYDLNKRKNGRGFEHENEFQESAEDVY
jgi:hypothetical protein